jgi:hypothetical protein
LDQKAALVKFVLALLQFLNQVIDPIGRESVKAVGEDSPIAIDSGLKFFALRTHGLTAVRREPKRSLSPIEAEVGAMMCDLSAYVR